MDMPTISEKYPAFHCTRCVHQPAPARFSEACRADEYLSMSHRQKLDHWSRQGQCPWFKEGA